MRSPYFNRSKRAEELFDVIGRYYPKFSSKDLSEQLVYKKIFKEKKYDYFKLKNVISDLYGLAMDFIKHRVSENTFEKELLFLEDLRKRKLEKHYETELKKVERSHLDKKIKNENYFFDLYRLTSEKIYYNFQLKPNTVFHMLQDEFDNFFLFSVIRLMKFYTLMFHEQRQNNFDYDMKLLDEIKQYLAGPEAENNPTFLLYKYILLLEENREKEHYYKVKEVHNKYSNVLTFTDNYMSYIHRIGFCAYLYNIVGDISFHGEMFGMQREMLEKGFYNNSVFPYPDFLNHVKIGTLAGEHNYVKNYIGKYKNRLPGDEKENCLNYVEAFIAFHLGKKQKSLDFVSRTNFSNFIMKIQVKIMQIQLYYELQMYEQLLGAVDTCRHYLKNESSLTDQYRETIAGFLGIVNYLALLNEDPKKAKDEYRKRDVIKQINALNTNVFGVKLWLMEQIKKPAFKRV